MMPFILWGWVMQDFKLLTRQVLETYLGSDTLSDVAIQDFLDSNASIVGTGKQEFFKNIENFLNSFKFDVEKRKNIHFEFKDLEIEENIVDDKCVFVYGSVQIYGLYDFMAFMIKKFQLCIWILALLLFMVLGMENGRCFIFIILFQIKNN